MNTRLSIVLWGIPDWTADRFFQRAEKKVTDLEKILSRFDADAEVFRVNRLAGHSWVPVSDKLWCLLLKAIDYHNRTSGYFDISRGRLYEQVRNGFPADRGKHCDLSQRIRWDEANKTVYFPEEDVSLDFGGIGKGIALQELAVMLEEEHIQNAFVSFGESSVLTRGKHPNGDYWPFTLAGNRAGQKVWKLTNDSVSVSSSQRASGANVSHHIVNPLTEQVPGEEGTVVVRTLDPVDAEVLSTALVAAPEYDRKKIIHRFDSPEIDLIYELYRYES